VLIRYPDDSGKLFEWFTYPAGEQQVRFTDEGVRQIKMSDKIQVIARITNSAHVVNLLLLSNALMHHAKRRETELILPYFPYARADRRFTDGDCWGLEMFRTLVDVMGYDKVKTLDVHSKVTEKRITSLFDNVDPSDFIDEALKRCTYRPQLLIPDAGAAERYHGALFCEKKRDSVTGKLTGFKVPPKEAFDGESILIVDDICDGGGTFIGIAEELRKQGVTQPLYLYVTHGVFSKGFDELNKHFEQIFTTNSFTEWVGVDKLTTFDCEPLLLGSELE
jgi:ribose-phosphate pyrophosphokinase